MRARLVALTTVLLLSLVAASPASAAAPVVGSGTNIVDFSTFQPAPPRQAGGNQIVDYTAQGTLAGIFSGPTTASGTLFFHSDGSRHVREINTCDCTYLGRTGTITTYVEGNGPDVNNVEATIVGFGSGGLAGLHFQGTAKQVAGGPYMMTVRVHFDPE